MYAYIIRRLLYGLLIIWGVYTITFLAVNLAPGDPFTGNENAKITEADLDRLRAKWGYDLSVPRRYMLHVRRMFWADAERLSYEGGGLGFEIYGADDGHNYVRAHVQEPPAEILLKPTRDSVLDEGSKEVRLKRLPDGSYESKSLIQGQYFFGRRKIPLFAAAVKLDSAGVFIRFDPTDMRVSAEISLPAPPDEVRLNHASGGAPVTLDRGADGDYGPMALAAGRYRDAGGGADLLVPEDVLGEGGLTFDLGTSIQHNKPVVQYLKPLLWNTMKLGFWALLINYLVGITLGVISAVKKDTPLDHGVMVGAFFLYSMPGFWLALMLQLLFAVTWSLLPLHGMGDGSLTDALLHYAMPVFVLGVAGAAGTARYQRSAVLEVLNEDYVRTARAKGVDEGTVIRKHVLRNSLLPIITLFGLSMPFLVSGAVIIERIFSWPGIGRAAITAIQGRDVFVVTAVTLMATIMVVIGNLLADIMYAVADPRLMLQ